MSSRTEDEAVAADFAAAARPLRVRTIEILWHCNDRNEEAEMLGMQSSVMEGITSVDYNPRCDRLVTTGGDGNIRLWQVRTAAVDAWLANNASDMLACCRHLCRMRTAWMPLTARWSPQGEMVASAHCDGKICLWWRDPAGGSAAASGGGGHSSGSGAEGNSLGALSTEDDGDVEEWKAYRHLTGHISDVYDLCFSADSRYLLSGAGDGSIVIHDLEASTMPVLQLTDLHTKFCRGVAWDPWTRYVHTFGCGPALLCFTHVPKAEGHRRMHLAGQRKCQGDFIGESCALSYRRLGWSPDGLLLAVPYGKFSRPSQSPAPTTATLLASIEAKERAEAHQREAAQSAAVAATITTAGAAAAAAAPSSVSDEARLLLPHGPASPTLSTAEDEAEDMLHCVYVYSRGAPEKVACRLGVRGFSEVRGVAWAPCFLEPLRADELQDQPVPIYMTVVDPAAAVSTETAAQAQGGGNKSNEQNEGGASAAFGSNGGGGTGVAAVDATAPSATSSPSAIPSTSSDAAAVAEAARQRRGAWGPAEYRMALAVWTSDAVIVYTTDSSTRHSDFTDLHMRSITDVAWSRDAAHLYTASLDGYISVIAFGDSLAVAHRLPTFAPSPAAHSLCALLERIEKVGLAFEDGRSSRVAAGAAAGRGTASGLSAAGSKTVSGGGVASVAVVRKKKKVEKKNDVDMQQLEALMSDI